MAQHRPPPGEDWGSQAGGAMDWPLRGDSLGDQGGVEAGLAPCLASPQCFPLIPDEACDWPPKGVPPAAVGVRRRSRI